MTKLINPIQENQSFKGIPKVFIIQARSGSLKCGNVEESVEEVVLKLFSTEEISCDYRYPPEGSKFMQEMCDKLDKGGEDLVTIMKKLTSH